MALGGGQFQSNFGPISGAATTTLVAAVSGQTCKVRELRLWVTGFGTIRLSDGTADLIQGLTGAGVGAPDGANVEIGLSSSNSDPSGTASKYCLACQAANRPLQLVTTGANAVFGGSIQYDMV